MSYSYKPRSDYIHSDHRNNFKRDLESLNPLHKETPVICIYVVPDKFVHKLLFKTTRLSFHPPKSLFSTFQDTTLKGITLIFNFFYCYPSLKIYCLLPYSKEMQVTDYSLSSLVSSELPKQSISNAYCSKANSIPAETLHIPEKKEHLLKGKEYLLLKQRTCFSEI